MKRLAIITARGGSKRIPRKNIKYFCGKPILAYSIEAALASKVFDQVMVSTDDEEIARVAEELGAKVPFFRSRENADDFSTTRDVVLEVLASYEKLEEHFERVCCIYPTAPFLTAEVLREAMELLEESGADSVLPVVKFDFPPQRSIVIREGKAGFYQPEYALTRSQDLEPFYHDVGQFYCLRTESFLEQKLLIMENTRALELPRSRVQDIDTPEDWTVAELKYRMLKEQETGNQTLQE